MLLLVLVILNTLQPFRVMVSFKNLIRGIEYVGIATTYAVRYYSEGKLNSDETIQFLQAQAIAYEYLDQASNFSPRVKKRLINLYKSEYYKRISSR